MSARTVNYDQGEKLVQVIPLCLITTSQNPRESHRGLLELFHEKGAAGNPPERRAEYIAHIDAHFPHIRQRAESIKKVGQLQPVTLRRFDSKGEDHYGIVQGECRILAWGLIEAEKGEVQKVKAIVEPKMTLDAAFERALAENIEREDMSPMDLAFAFHEMLTVRINPATAQQFLDGGEKNPLWDEKTPKGRPYTLREIAEKIRRDYHWVRSRAALYYLSQNDKEQVETDHREGRRDLTRFCKKAAKLATALKTKAKDAGTTVEVLLEQVGWTTGAAACLGLDDTEPATDNGLASPAEPSILTVQPTTNQRRRVRSLKDVESLFDATPLENVERLLALAEVMGISKDPQEALRVALEEREERAKTAEIRSGREALRATQQQKTA
jgi:hypothetical protein